MTVRYSLGVFLAVAGLALSPAQAGATPLIDTRVPGLGGSVAPFGESNTATYGQTFTVTGAETQLNSFSFWFDDLLNPDFVDFAAYVMEWNGTQAIGPVLYASAPRSSTNNGGAGGFERFDFLTGGLQLGSGVQYVAFLSVSNFFDGSAGTSTWELEGDTYALGNFVFYNNGNNFGLLSSSAWDCGGSCLGGLDASFVAEFSTPVPEPASMTLIGTGLAALIARRRRRTARV